MIDLISLNDSQKQAVTTLKQYARVIAGAGSGKTKVLTTRIAFIIESIGIPGNNIYAITFTNKAANEMKERVKKIVPSDMPIAVLSTFHSLCLRILRENSRDLDYPNFTVLDSEDAEKIVKEILKKRKGEIDKITPGEALSFISKCKCSNINVEEAKVLAKNYYGEKAKAEIYEDYEKQLKENCYFDFDDLLLKAIELLKLFPNVRKKWHNRIEHLLVDEFQDTNDIQYQLIRLLLKDTASLFVVGDPDQTIYTWRGANADLLVKFERDFPEAETFILNRNYRSTQTILNSANSLIKNNKTRIDKDLYTENNEGNPIVFKQSPTSVNEAKWVTDRIRELINIEDAQYKDIVILYRSNYISRDFEMALLEKNMPYKIFGGVKFFERKEVKDAICYLRVLIRQDDNLAFARIINVPKRGIGASTIEYFIDRSESGGVSLYTTAQLLRNEIITSKGREGLDSLIALFDSAKKLIGTGVSFSEILNHLLINSGYLEELKKKEEFERIENINELRNYLDEFETNNPGSTLEEALQNIALYSSQDELDDGQYISLMTIHTAKGLEFDYVFLVGLSENVFPNTRALEEGSIEEERRLAYVALTRAKKQLFLSCNSSFNYATSSMNIISRFCKEAGIVVHKEVQHFSDEPQPFFFEPRPKPVKMAKTHAWQIGDLLEHSFYGPGRVAEVISDTLIRIVFDNKSHGAKTLLGAHDTLKRIK